MDIEKVGKYIAQCRKEKGLTQAALAAQLHITDKAVSKWERGLSLPDVTLLTPLSQALDISVTELLQGKSMEYEQVSKDITDKLLAESSSTYVAEANNKSKFLITILLITVFILAILFPLAYHYQKIQSDLSEISHPYHAVSDNIVLLYETLTDNNRDVLSELDESEYNNALFYVSSASAILESGRYSMLEYQSMLEQSEALEADIAAIYNTLCNATYENGRYLIPSFDEYEMLISSLYDEYHKFKDCFESLRKNASVRGLKSF